MIYDPTDKDSDINTSLPLFADINVRILVTPSGFNIPSHTVKDSFSLLNLRKLLL